MNKFTIFAIFIIAFSAAIAHAEQAEAEATCVRALPEGKKAGKCEKEAKREDACTDCVTSSCGACRKRYIKYCTRPEYVDSEEKCLDERCKNLSGDRWHTGEEKTALCRKGLAGLCREHICEKPKQEVLSITAKPHVEPEPKEEPNPKEDGAMKQVSDLCPEGTEIAKYEWNGSKYIRERGTECGVSGDASELHWNAANICYVVLKAATEARLIDVRATDVAAKFDKHDISHVRFCACKAGEEKEAAVVEPEPKDEKEEIGAPEPECEMPAKRSKSDCKKEAERDDRCTDCVTSSCNGCRAVYIKYCEKPEAETDLEQCLHKRCDVLKGDKWHDREEKLELCHKAMKPLCKDHICEKPKQEVLSVTAKPHVEPEPHVEPKPHVEPEPHVEPHVEPEPHGEPEPECVLAKKTVKDCTELARDACTNKVTSKYTACRKRFFFFCRNPKAVASEESCIDERCASFKSDRWHSKEEKIEVCRDSLRGQCRAQVCKKDEETAAPTTTTTAAPTTTTTAARTTRAAMVTEAPKPKVIVKPCPNEGKKDCDVGKLKDTVLELSKLVSELTQKVIKRRSEKCPLEEKTTAASGEAVAANRAGEEETESGKSVPVGIIVGSVLGAAAIAAAVVAFSVIRKRRLADGKAPYQPLLE